MIRELDEVTQASLVSLFAAALLLISWKSKSGYLLPIGLGLGLYGLYLWLDANRSLPGVDFSQYHRFAFFQEIGAPNINKIAPGSTGFVATEAIALPNRPGEAYVLRNGVNAYVTPAGEVKPYSLFSQLLTPGWKTTEQLAQTDYEELSTRY